MRKLKFVCVCGHGMGTVFIMKMTVEEALKGLGVEAEIIPTDIMTVGGFLDADVIVANVDFKENLKPLGKKLLLLDNFLDKEEAKNRLRPILKEIGYDLKT